MPPRNIHWPEELEIPAGFDDSEAPDALLCPITQELMRCPALLTVTGRTYELSAIKRWIGEHGTCPMDRTQRISEQDLAPNLGIRQLVESFVDDRSGGARAANTNLPACPPPAARPASPARLPPPPAQAEVPSQDAQAPDDPFTPNFDLPPPSSTAGIRVVDNKHPSGGEGCFFRFWADDLTSIVGAWAQAGDRARTGHVKEGQGAVFRAENLRTGKRSGVLVWGPTHPGGAASGCWNPPEFAAPEDWRAGDELVLLDFQLPLPGRAAVAVQEVRTLTGTGWKLKGNQAAFGQCGLVGEWWKALELHFVLDGPQLITGVRTDAGEQLPYAVSVLGEDNRWSTVRRECVGTTVLRPAQRTEGVRVRWETTDLHKSEGLSSARAGGGLHAELLTVEREGSWEAAGASAMRSLKV